MSHYLQTTDDDFDRAAGTPPDQQAAQNPAQQTAESPLKPVHGEP